MKTKAVVMADKTVIIAVIIAAIVLFFSGWFIGNNASKCKCNVDCCHQEQNINQNQ